MNGFSRITCPSSYRNRGQEATLDLPNQNPCLGGICVCKKLSKRLWGELPLANHCMMVSEWWDLRLHSVLKTPWEELIEWRQEQRQGEQSGGYCRGPRLTFCIGQEPELKRRLGLPPPSGILVIHRTLSVHTILDKWYNFVFSWTILFSTISPQWSSQSHRVCLRCIIM